MSQLLARQGPSWASRLLWWTLVVALACATGSFWASQRAQRGVSATGRMELSGALQPDGTLQVDERLVITDHVGQSITRVIATPGGIVWRGVTDAAENDVAHTTLQVTDGLVVTVEEEQSSAVLNLTYELRNAAVVGSDAVELVWPVSDDRSLLALTALTIQASWSGGGRPQVVQVQAPGTAATVVSSDGALVAELGRLPAHHTIELHAAMPFSAAPMGPAEDRSIMQSMTEGESGPTLPDGGGPWWVPLVVASVFLLAWGALHRRHGAEPEVSWPGPVTEPPSTHSPAEVAWLLHRGSARDSDLSATLLDLQARGIIMVAEGPTLQVSAGRAQDLQPHEQVLIEWLRAAGNQTALSDLQQRVRHDPDEWRSMRRRFNVAVQTSGRSSGLLERTVDAESVLGAGLAGATMVVGGVIGVALGQPAWLVCVAAGALAIVFTDTLARRTDDGARLAADWLSYAGWLAAGEQGLMPGHALVLGLREPDGALPSNWATSTVAQLQDAFVTATSFVAAPKRRLSRVSR